MRIVGNHSFVQNSAISSGLDSVAEGIVQSTQNPGTANLDSVSNTFSVVDPNAESILNQPAQITGVAEYPDPASFLKSSGQDEALKTINDPRFRPAAEMGLLSQDLSRMLVRLPANQQVKVLKEMNATMRRLNELQSSVDLRLQKAHFFGGPAKIGPEATGARDAAVQKNEKEVEKETAEPEGTMQAEFGAVMTEEKDPIGFEPSTNASLGPILEGHADADLGKNTYLDLGGEAFIGAKASAGGTAEVGEYGSVSGGVGAYAGVGAKGDIDVGVKDGKFSFKFGGGLALGIGAELNLGFDLDYEKIANDLYNAGSDLADNLESAFDWLGDETKSAGETAEDTAEDIIDAAEDTADDVVDGLGDLADSAGDVLDDVFDW